MTFFLAIIIKRLFRYPGFKPVWDQFLRDHYFFYSRASFFIIRRYQKMILDFMRRIAFTGRVPGPAGIKREGTCSADGIVQLSWKAVVAGAGAMDGSCVVTHEFAHALDEERGIFDGFPSGLPGELHRPWILLMEKHRRDDILRKKCETLLSRHSVANTSEVFAYLSEHFFDAPHTIKRRFPDAYTVLCHYYRQDPAQIF